MKKAEIPFDFGDEIFVFKLNDGNLIIIPTTVNLAAKEKGLRRRGILSFLF